MPCIETSASTVPGVEEMELASDPPENAVF